VDPAEFAYYKRALSEQGLIETSDNDLQQAIITPSGWTKLGSSGTNSRIAFVAMSFAPSLEVAFTNGIEKAIGDAGYEPLRVDKVHHNEKICDRIVVEIRRSRFVIADVTQHRQGVYFEAGFAMGLGLPVIWSCQKDDLPNAHFDTRQYNHVVWETSGDLRNKLRDRIDATMSLSRAR
jgi:nucleoside 2-deoxyribosyltransferase